MEEWGLFRFRAGPSRATGIVIHKLMFEGLYELSQGSHKIEMWALVPADEKEAWPPRPLSILPSIVHCVSWSAAIHCGTARQKLFYSHSPHSGHCCDMEGKSPASI